MITAPEAPESAPEAPESLENRFVYDGRLGKVAGIWFATLLLSIVTLGIYQFWGKTNLRKYVAGGFSLNGDRFEYTGTGWELFLGFLKALPFIILFNLFVFSSAFIAHFLFSGALALFVQFSVLSLLGLYLFFVAIYMGLRYRLSRILWRGVRGKLSESAFGFAKYAVFYTLIKIFTLGICGHYSDIMLYKRIAEKAQFGSAKFTFNGKARSLFWINLITLLLAIPTVFISRFWYAAALMRYQAAHTKVENLSLKATYTGFSLFLFSLVNALILIFTLGFGAPIVIQRRINYFVKNTSILGDIDTSAVLQSDEELGNSGEGLDSALGLDSGLM